MVYCDQIAHILFHKLNNALALPLKGIRQIDQYVCQRFIK